MATHVYLSAHLDDAVYSCGGLIHRQAQAGESVLIVTAFAGDPPPGPLTEFALSLQARWNLGDTPVAGRRQEDRAAGRVLGVRMVHLSWAEALYRQDVNGQPLYPSEAAIFEPIRQDDPALGDGLLGDLRAACPTGAQVYVPLALGGHVDHCALRRSAERMDRPLVYYADFPYARRGGSLPAGLGLPAGVARLVRLKPQDVGAWAQAAARYRSQLSTFWDDEHGLELELAQSLIPDGAQRLIGPADPDLWPPELGAPTDDCVQTHVRQ